MIILGLDPGTAIVGWGAIELDMDAGAPRCLAYDCITTPKELRDSERLVLIERGLQEVLRRFTPDLVAVERIFFTTNRRTAISVAQARGVIICTCQREGVPVIEFNPMEVKIAVTGYGKSEKKAVQSNVAEFLGLDHIPKPDDAADALAIALAAGQHAERERI
jgi:crossover junction endodeoxyribonuclease RuvC